MLPISCRSLGRGGAGGVTGLVPECRWSSAPPSKTRHLMSECRVDSPLAASASLLVKSHFVPMVLLPTCTTQSNQHVETTGAFPLSVRQILSQWQRQGVSFHKVIWHFATLCSLALVGNRGNLPQAGRCTKLPGIRGIVFSNCAIQLKRSS